MKIRDRVSAFVLLLAFALSPNVMAQAGANYNFKRLDGGTMGLSELRGHVVVLSFSAKGIPLARFELPQLERLATRFASQGVVVLWVSINSANPKGTNYATDEELRTLAGQYPHLTVVRDPDGVISRQLGANTLPTILILDQRGKLVGQPHSGIDPQVNLTSDLAPTINHLLAE